MMGSMVIRPYLRNTIIWNVKTSIPKKETLDEVAIEMTVQMKF